MAQFLGFEIKRATDVPKQELDAVVPKIEDDGALVVAAGGVYGTVVDLEGSAKNEAELVTKYREMSLHPEVEKAVDDVCQESIVTDSEDIVKMNLDKLNDLSPNIKQAIADEFANVLQLLDFTNQGYEIFKRWYVDGRLYYQAVIDKNNPREGLQELRYIDPRKIKKVKETKKKKVGNTQTQATVTETGTEYYVYNEKGFQASGSAVAAGLNQTATTGLKIAKDSILFCTSGILDKSNTLVLSHLHKAIKPLNNLRSLEDATVIYRIARAPERRIFYIDVGNLPKMKAEQYLRDMMTRHKNKVVYDSATGEIRDDRKFMTMLEDYWLPRREGGRGTEITTLPGGQNLGEMTDVEYFQKKLYESLNVPTSRLQSDNAFNMGRASEITRDEVKFSKFIDRLRGRFNQLFLKSLEKQVVLKGVMTIEDWQQISPFIKFVYTRDNFFAELKEAEILRERMTTLEQMMSSQIVGKYYSHEWVRVHILKQTEEEIEQQNAQIQAEQNDPILNPPIEPGMDQAGGGQPNQQ